VSPDIKAHMNTIDIDSIPPSRMMPDEKPAIQLPQFDNEMWFLQILSEREQAAVKLAYEYAKMGSPGLPNHMYLTVIHTLSELLQQVNVELENGDD